MFPGKCCVAVLEVERVRVAVADVHGDDAAGSVGVRGHGAQLGDAGGDALGVLGAQAEEGFVAEPGEGEDGLLSGVARFMRVFEVVVEGAAEGVGSCGGGDEE
ncbi:hypothetical protein V496_07155, partial [Pseudogymnoascus sp. VKM F-4515 (FW-2607)]